MTRSRACRLVLVVGALVIAGCSTPSPIKSQDSSPIDRLGASCSDTIAFRPGAALAKLDDFGATLGFARTDPALPKSPLCAPATDPELVAIGALLDSAAQDEKKGNATHAAELRQQARDRLNAFRATLHFSSAALPHLAAVRAGAGYNPPPDIARGYQAARDLALAGDQSGADALLGDVRGAIRDWASSAANGKLDADDALAIARDLQISGAEGPDGPISTALLQMAREQRQKEFNDAARKLPCPPSRADLDALFKAARAAVLLGADYGQGAGSIQGTMLEAAENYFRSAAQTASGADAAKLGSEAGRVGLPADLPQQIKDGKAAPPRCAVGVHVAATRDFPDAILARYEWTFDAWNCTGIEGEWHADLEFAITTSLGESHTVHATYKFPLSKNAPRAVARPDFGPGYEPDDQVCAEGIGCGRALDTAALTFEATLVDDQTGPKLRTTVPQDVIGFLSVLQDRTMPIQKTSRADCAKT